VKHHRAQICVCESRRSYSVSQYCIFPASIQTSAARSTTSNCRAPAPPRAFLYIAPSYRGNGGGSIRG